MVNHEQGIIWTAHPRTKSSEGYPEKYKDKDFFLSDRFIGASWESLPVDLSEKRLCEVRCFGTGDDMSNWAPKPKYLIAEGDTYTKWPDDETYPQLAVNYLKLDRVPLYNESWAPIVEGIRAGNFFGTTGEVLFHDWGVEGSGAKSTYTQASNILFRSSSQSWFGVMAPRSTGRSSISPKPFLSATRLQDSLRCDREEMGPVCSMGFRRRWRLSPADRP